MNIYKIEAEVIRTIRVTESASIQAESEQEAQEKFKKEILGRYLNVASQKVTSSTIECLGPVPEPVYPEGTELWFFEPSKCRFFKETITKVIHLQEGDYCEINYKLSNKNNLYGKTKQEMIDNCRHERFFESKEEALQYLAAMIEA